jgi:hypothetical protein
MEERLTRKLAETEVSIRAVLVSERNRIGYSPELLPGAVFLNEASLAVEPVALPKNI